MKKICNKLVALIIIFTIYQSFNQVYAQSPNLVHQWNFEDGSNDGNIVDVIGSSNGTVMDGSERTLPGPEGNVGINLDTDGAYIEFGTLSFGNAFTITGHYVSYFNSGENVILSGNNHCDGDNSFVFTMSGTSLIFRTFSLSGVEITATTVSGSHIAGEWNHFALVVNKINGTCNIYINGTDQTVNSAINTDFNTTTDFWLGLEPCRQSRLYGYLDDIRIYNRALTSSEINIVKTGAYLTGGTVSVTGLSVSPSSTSVVTGNTVQLTATITPSNATNQTVTWTSNNTSVSTVSSSGLVTGNSAGSAIITATTQDGGFTASSTVTVTTSAVAVTGISVSPSSTSVVNGNTVQLTATITPSNATNKNVTWGTSNSSVATVSASGLVTGVATGTANITATTQDGGYTATCAITVSEPDGGTSPWQTGTEGIYYNSGNVGIGTQVPYSKLSLGSVSNIANRIAVFENTTTNPGQFFYGIGLANPSTGVYGLGIYGGTNTSLPSNTNMHIFIKNNGNIGIGTTSPNSKLEVNGTIHSTSGGFKLPDGTVLSSSSQLGGGGGTTAQEKITLQISSSSGFNYPGLTNDGLFDNSAEGEYGSYIIYDGGSIKNLSEVKLYFGTNSGDLYKYSIQGSVDNSVWQTLYTAPTYVGGTVTHSISGVYRYLKLVATDYNDDRFFVCEFEAYSSSELWRSNGNNIFYMEGNVGIGTTNLGDGKLAVNGKILATEVEVKVFPWSDYVFTKDYYLRPLNQVEQFINKNGHLPEVPSATEVEENGVKLGEMNALLLKKIEELTLYMIELKKENGQLKKRVEALEKSE